VFYLVRSLAALARARSARYSEDGSARSVINPFDRATNALVRGVNTYSGRVLQAKTRNPITSFWHKKRALAVVRCSAKWRVPRGAERRLKWNAKTAYLSLTVIC